jgi:hypothetical protein
MVAIMCQKAIHTLSKTPDNWGGRSLGSQRTQSFTISNLNGGKKVQEKTEELQKKRMKLEQEIEEARAERDMWQGVIIKFESELEEIEAIRLREENALGIRRAKALLDSPMAAGAYKAGVLDAIKAFEGDDANE